jgi:hypothetical protein
MIKVIKISLFIVIFLSGVILIVLFMFFDYQDLLLTSNPVDIQVMSDIPEMSDSLLLRQMEIDNIYWSKRIEMARDKSIDMLVDLVSKEICLEINGVLVYTATIKNYIFNSHLRKMLEGNGYKSWLSESRLLENEWASIAKEPIQIRDIRPRSEDETILTHFRDPEAENEARIILHYSGQLTIILRQIEPVPDSLRATDIPVVNKPYMIELFVSKISACTIFRALKAGESSLAIRSE